MNPFTLWTVRAMDWCYDRPLFVLSGFCWELNYYTGSASINLSYITSRARVRLTSFTEYFKQYQIT